MRRTFISPMSRLTFSFCLLLIARMAFASDTSIECPSEIPIEHIQISASTDAWVQRIKSPMPLTSAGFMQAPPEKMAYLKPSSTIERKNSTAVIWKFEGDYPLGKWLTCEYANGVVSKSKEIDKNLTECVVTYDKKSKNHAITLSCK